MSDDYEIGYGKPPKSGQFKKGQSGNPKGRPKGSRNFKTDLHQELQSYVLIKEGGKHIKVTKQQALTKRLVTNALNGDMKSTQFIANFFSDQGDTEAMDDLMQADEVILNQFLTAIKTKGKSDDTSG